MSAAAPALPVLQVRLRREDESPAARLAVGGGGGGGASPPLPPAQRSAAEDAALLGRANALLAFVGLRARARCADDAVAVCARSSVFVAAVEAALGHRLEGAQPQAGMVALEHTQRAAGMKPGADPCLLCAFSRGAAPPAERSGARTQHRRSHPRAVLRRARRGALSRLAAAVRCVR